MLYPDNEYFRQGDKPLLNAFKNTLCTPKNNFCIKKSPPLTKLRIEIFYEILSVLTILQGLGLLKVLNIGCNQEHSHICISHSETISTKRTSVGLLEPLNTDFNHASYTVAIVKYFDNYVRMAQSCTVG
jgi:hypothetical protein